MPRTRSARTMQSMATQSESPLPMLAEWTGRALRVLMLYSPGVIGPALVVIGLIMVAPWLGILGAGVILWAFDVVSTPGPQRGRHRPRTRTFGDGRQRPVMRSDDLA